MAFIILGIIMGVGSASIATALIRSRIKKKAMQHQAGVQAKGSSHSSSSSYSNVKSASRSKGRGGNEATKNKNSQKAQATQAEMDDLTKQVHGMDVTNNTRPTTAQFENFMNKYNLDAEQLSEENIGQTNEDNVPVDNEEQKVQVGDFGVFNAQFADEFNKQTNEDNVPVDNEEQEKHNDTEKLQKEIRVALGNGTNKTVGLTSRQQMTREKILNKKKNNSKNNTREQ